MKPHRDSEKTPGMFATLVVTLPSTSTGGELVVNPGEEREQRYDLASRSPFSSSFESFYADCKHEVLPITSGNRLCLVYNLVKTSPGPVPSPANFNGRLPVLVRACNQWAAKFAADGKKLVVMTSEGRKRSACEKAMASLLKAAVAAEADLRFDSANIEYSEEGYADGFEGYRRHRVDDWEDYCDHDFEWGSTTNWEMEMVLSKHGKLDVNRQKEILPSGYFDDLDPQNEEFEPEHRGSTVYGKRTFFTQRCLVIWPRSAHLLVISNGSVPRMAGLLLKESAALAAPKAADTPTVEDGCAGKLRLVIQSITKDNASECILYRDPSGPRGRVPTQMFEPDLSLVQSAAEVACRLRLLPEALKLLSAWPLQCLEDVSPHCSTACLEDLPPAVRGGGKSAADDDGPACCVDMFFRHFGVTEVEDTLLAISDKPDLSLVTSFEILSKMSRSFPAASESTNEGSSSLSSSLSASGSPTQPPGIEMLVSRLAVKVLTRLVGTPADKIAALLGYTAHNNLPSRPVSHVHDRPRGRPPKGKHWSDTRCMWVADHSVDPKSETKPRLPIDFIPKMIRILGKQDPIVDIENLSQHATKSGVKLPGTGTGTSSWCIAVLIRAVGKAIQVAGKNTKLVKGLSNYLHGADGRDAVIMEALQEVLEKLVETGHLDVALEMMDELIAETPASDDRCFTTLQSTFLPAIKLACSKVEGLGTMPSEPTTSLPYHRSSTGSNQTELTKRRNVIKKVIVLTAEYEEPGGILSTALLQTLRKFDVTKWLAPMLDEVAAGATVSEKVASVWFALSVFATAAVGERLVVTHTKPTHTWTLLGGPAAYNAFLSSPCQRQLEFQSPLYQHSAITAQLSQRPLQGLVTCTPFKPQSQYFLRITKPHKVPILPGHAIPACNCAPDQPNPYYGPSSRYYGPSSRIIQSNGSGSGQCDLRNYHAAVKKSEVDKALFAKLKSLSETFQAALGASAAQPSSSAASPPSSSAMDVEEATASAPAAPSSSSCIPAISEAPKHKTEAEASPDEEDTEIIDLTDSLAY